MTNTACDSVVTLRALLARGCAGKSVCVAESALRVERSLRFYVDLDAPILPMPANGRPDPNTVGIQFDVDGGMTLVVKWRQADGCGTGQHDGFRRIPRLLFLPESDGYADED